MLNQFSLSVSRAAVEEGVVAGGGVALIRALAEVELKGENHDQDMGINIAKRAMEEPLRQIVANAGGEPSVVLNRVTDASGSQGFNAATETYEDLVKAGVIDPTKVVRTALQNASSIASLLLTTECMVTDAEEDDDDHHDHY